MGLFDRLRGASDQQVVFLGIDGVPFELIQNNPDVFENLTTIGQNGSHGQIESIVPPESSACWPSLTTGRNPGATSVYGFQDRTLDSYETYIPMGRHVRAKRLWDRVTDAGRKATVLNVPVTYPPSDTIQRQVAGFLSGDLQAAAGESIDVDLLSELGYQVDVDVRLGHEDKDAFVEDAHATLAGRYETFKHYIEEDDWDLFFGVFMATDRMNHFLYGDYENETAYAEDFLEFYRELDAYIGALHSRLDEEATLVVASDHGFTELEYEVNCNRWLEREGWLSYDADNPEELRDISHETRAYSLIPGRFFLNLEGREPAGVVSPTEYEAVREELIAALKRLTGPDGRRVTRRIVKGEEVFKGAHDEIAPDVVVIPEDGFDLKADFGANKDVFTTGPRNGMHKFGNACLFSTAELDLADANLYDIAPTIIDLMDINIDTRGLEGRSLVV